MRTKRTRPRYPWDPNREVRLILPHLFQGGEENLENKAWLSDVDIAAVLSVTDTRAASRSDFDCAQKDADLLHINVDDVPGAGQQLFAAMPECLAFLDRHRTQGNNVLVHCQQGVSRSSTVVLSYLMWHLGVELYQAWHFVEGVCQKHCEPNPGFEALLLDWERQGRHVHARRRKNAELRRRDEAYVAQLEDAVFLRQRRGSGDGVLASPFDPGAAFVTSPSSSL